MAVDLPKMVAPWPRRPSDHLPDDAAGNIEMGRTCETETVPAALTGGSETEVVGVAGDAEAGPASGSVQGTADVERTVDPPLVSTVLLTGKGGEQLAERLPEMVVAAGFSTPVPSGDTCVSNRMPARLLIESGDHPEDDLWQLSPDAVGAIQIPNQS